MNSAANRTLKRLALYAIASLFLIFAIEFLFISYRIEGLEEIEEKKDFARSAQMDGQEIAYLVQRHSSGETGLEAEILARMTALGYDFQVLGNGGRIRNSRVFLQPLSRLPRITYDNLVSHWEVYREQIHGLIGQAGARIDRIDSVTVADSLSSVVSTAPAATPSVLAGQWITVSDWFEKLMADLADEAEARKESVEDLSSAFAIVDLLLLAGLFFLFDRHILRPLAVLRKNTAGRIQAATYPPNEIGALTREVNEIIEQLTDATEFVTAIGKGQLDFDYRTLDAEYKPGTNVLADSLISLQAKLKNMNEEEQKRQWANDGLSKFVDILRSSNDNINTLGDKIISAMVKFTNSNQGGLYVLNDEDERNRHLELISLFAFDNKKFESRRVRLGEGILGQTFLEKETTLLNELPDDYVRITSGLGGANPRSLLIVPLKVDREVYGIVELASFYPFQQHEIAFVERLAETIASTLASVKVSQKNRQLIEQFQQQTEEMRSHEEEMRQNMEELQATQEEVSRKEQEYIQQIRQMESRVQNSVLREEHDKLRAEYEARLHESARKIRELEARLAVPQRSDDWALAEQVEKELRIHLEALKISEEELAKKRKS